MIINLINETLDKQSRMRKIKVSERLNNNSYKLIDELCYQKNDL